MRLRERRWWALAVLSGLQFMLVLDITIVNVALPRIQQSLGFSESGLAWVVNGYVVMAGGMLILGGRLGDFFGRRRLLLCGVALFAGASALCGAAVTPSMMVVGRFAQGAGEALSAPASLGLLALIFTDAKERTKALGIWGGLTAIGGTLGYVISGVLTDLASWRWIFLIILPVAVVTLALVPRLVPESRSPGHRLDVAGAASLTAALVSIVFALLRAADHSWGSLPVVLSLGAGVVLLAATVAIERRARDPLMPLAFFANRTRSVINAVSLGFMAAFISYTFMLTLFEQQVRRYSPLQGGLSWVPLGLAIGVGIGLGSGLTPRLGVKAVTALGFAGAGAGLAVTSFIGPGATYLTDILPGMLIFGLFAGMTMPSATTAALHGVTVENSGLASGVQTTMQQIGWALGLAVLVPVAVRHASALLHSGHSVGTAMTAGYVLAFRIGAALLLLGALLVAVCFEQVAPESRDARLEALQSTR